MGVWMMGLGVATWLSAATMAQSSPESATTTAPVRPVYAGLAVRGRVASENVDAVRAELARRFGERGVKVVAPRAVAVSTEHKARALDALDAQLAIAGAAFKRREWEEARIAMTTALSIFEEGLAFTEDDDAWARYRSLLLLAADAQLVTNDLSAADDTLRQLLAIEPDLAPTTAMKANLSARTIERLIALRARPQASTRSTLEVKSRPPGARVLVDGRGAGRAPVAIEVLPGIHYVAVSQDGALVTERVVVTPAGARVTARLGAAEAEAGSILVRRLQGGLSKREFTEAAADVADVTFAAVVVPWGPTAQILIARVTDGALDAVHGTRLPRNEAQRDAALYQLIEAALTRTDDGWVGVTEDPATLRSAFLQGVGDETAVLADEREPVPVPLVVGGVVGGLAVVAGAAAVVALVWTNDARKDEGFRYVVDASAFE